MPYYQVCAGFLPPCTSVSRRRSPDGAPPLVIARGDLFRQADRLFVSIAFMIRLLTSRDRTYLLFMRNAAAAALVFIGGFIIMVLEIIGARFLAKDFGSSFHVWVSQIGVVLIALALGYYLGGALADRWQRLSVMVLLLVPAGLVLVLIPNIAVSLIDAIILRHPPDQAIPLFWQKFDPVLGSAMVFLMPCVVLAMLSPYMIRLATRSLTQVGRSSGFIIAASTVGSIAGVFVAGFVLIDRMGLSSIFRVMGALTVLLGFLCVAVDPWLRPKASAQQ